MAQIVDFAFIEVASVACQGVTELSVSEETSGLEAVPALSPSRIAIGHKEGVDMFTASITHKRLLPLEVDYHALRRDKTVFQVVYTERAGNVLGKTYQLIDCRVASVAKGFTAEGETADVVQLVPLNHIEE
jgi:hypothetical protein